MSTLIMTPNYINSICKCNNIISYDDFYYTGDLCDICHIKACKAISKINNKVEELRSDKFFSKVQINDIFSDESGLVVCLNHNSLHTSIDINIYIDNHILEKVKSHFY